MPFAIKAQGQTYKTEQFVIPEAEDGSVAFSSFESFLLWDHYIGLLAKREEAVRLFIKYDELGHQIDQRGLDHPKAMAALAHLFSLENRIIQEQVGFLAHERFADRIWRSMLVRERQEEGVHELYRVDPARNHLLGLWPHRFGGEWGGDAYGYRLHPTALLAATQEQEREYAVALWQEGRPNV